MGNLLSGGEQQMLAVGRALMTNPRLLILDEATEGLAPLIRAEIWHCLTRLKAAGQSILVIDKNVEALTRIADRHYLIERGRVVWSGTSAELAAAPQVQHQYLGDLPRCLLRHARSACTGCGGHDAQWRHSPTKVFSTSRRFAARIPHGRAAAA